MRSLMMTAILVSAVPVAAGAVAQQQGFRRAAPPTAGMQHRPATHRPATPQTRWGNRHQGRWHAGYRAPGGWSAYRRPVRGYVVPRYWIQPSFYIADFAGYGLGAPQPGYGWYRYYDDAVLVDERGYVQDSVAGIEWDRDGASYVDYDAPYRDDYYADRAPADDPGYRPERRDNGVGGALIGGAVGAVAGVAIAGPGNRLGGALIGGGVGAVAGAVIDRAEDRGRRGPPPPPPIDSRRGVEYADAPLPPIEQPDAPIRYGARGEIVQPLPGEHHAGYDRRDYREHSRTHGGTTTTTTYHHAATPQPHTVTTTPGYVAHGYYYPPVTTTTITYSQPVTTTTVTEEYVRYSAPAKTKRMHRSTKRKWKAKPRCAC